MTLFSSRLKFLRSSNAGGAKLIDALRQRISETKVRLHHGVASAEKSILLQELDDLWARSAACEKPLWMSYGSAKIMGGHQNSGGRIRP